MKKLRKISNPKYQSLWTLRDTRRESKGSQRGAEAVFKHLNFVQLPCMFIFFLLCVVLLSWKEEENLWFKLKKRHFLFQSFCSVDIYVWNLTLLGSLPSCDLEQNICSLQWNYVSLWSSPTRHVTPSSGSTTNLVLQIQYLCNRASIRCFFCFIWPLQYFYLKILLYSDLEKVH